jgi:hypothetical protein
LGIMYKLDFLLFCTLTKLQIFLIFRFYLGRLARGRECDAAHWPLTATGSPPGLAARGRGRDAAHLLLLDPGSRLGHGKNVVKKFF